MESAYGYFPEAIHRRRPHDSRRGARGRRAAQVERRATRMARIEGEIVIDRPVDVVFDFVEGERNKPRFNPKLVRVEQISAGPIRPRHAVSGCDHEHGSQRRDCHRAHRLRATPATLFTDAHVGHGDERDPDLRGRPRVTAAAAAARRVLSPSQRHDSLTPADPPVAKRFAAGRHERCSAACATAAPARREEERDDGSTRHL